MKRLLTYLYLFMIIVFVVVHFVISPIFNKIYWDYFKPDFADYCRDIFRGSFYVIETELKRTPKGQWDQVVKSMQSHFNFPLAMSSIDALSLQKTDRLDLAEDNVVVQFEEDMVILHQRLGETNMVLTMGPVRPFDYDKFLLDMIYSLVIVALFSIFALLVAWPYANRLRRISIAAEAFGEGNLDARAILPPRSSLAHLANAFNSMAARIQELIRSHKELTHAVSHELRTPLARLRFSMEMIATVDEPDNKEKHLDGMRRDVDELDLLVSELLTYAKLDKSYRPRMEEMDLGPWLSDLAVVLDAETSKATIECRISSPDPKVPLLASPRFLERALRNLVQNAVLHANSRIQITLKTVDKQAIIHVDDDGPGIPPADRQRIFEPFVQLDAHRDSDVPGYGLGLAIVDRVAKWHDGSVTVSEAPIGGARLSLNLPLTDKRRD
ncbi:MAG: ATP-binding protein [Desulfobacteraceae bacterium]